MVRGADRSSSGAQAFLRGPHPGLCKKLADRLGRMDRAFFGRYSSGQLACIRSVKGYYVDYRPRP
jgi:hypothetical protein